MTSGSSLEIVGLQERVDAKNREVAAVDTLICLRDEIDFILAGRDDSPLKQMASLVRSNYRGRTS